MSLALATLIYEWRRYLAAVIALAFSGMMVMAFSGMFAGIIHAEFATWERSRADLIILPPNVKALVNSNASLPSRVKPLIYLNPDVAEVESISGSGAQWSNVARPGQKQVQTFVQTFGVQPYPNSVTLPKDFTEQERIALMEPGAVAIDASSMAPLGAKLGDKASLNGQSVWVRAILHGYQSPEQPLVVASYQTMRQIGLERDGRVGGGQRRHRGRRPPGGAAAVGRRGRPLRQGRAHLLGDEGIGPAQQGFRAELAKGTFRERRLRIVTDDPPPRAIGPRRFLP